MAAVLTLTRTLIINRVRAQKKVRYLTYGSSIMVVSMMFYFTQGRMAQAVPSPEVVEFSAWRILSGLTFTVMAMGLSEMGSEPEQEFLVTLGVRESTYMWAKWLDLATRSLPWFLWGASWAVATASAIPGRPFATLLGLAGTLFLYALFGGGCLGFGLELLLRKMRNGQRISKGFAMFAPMVLVMAMMGMGQNMPVPPSLHAVAWLTPIGAYRELLFGDSTDLLLVFQALATVIPWAVCMWLVGLGWSLRREASGRGDARRDSGASHTTAIRFTNSPFITKDLVMLQRYRFTLFRGVVAAAFLVLPFTFLNTQTLLPLFIRFFEVMIIVAASGMMFGLLLPAMDREVLWLIRVTGRLRIYVLQKFALVAAITLGFSSLIIVPLTFTMNLPLLIVAPLTVVGSGLMASLSLIASGVAFKMGVDMVTRPDANIVMGVMIAFGFFLATAVLGYMVSWILFVGFLVLWCVVTASALGVAVYIIDTIELA